MRLSAILRAVPQFPFHLTLVCLLALAAAFLWPRRTSRAIIATSGPFFRTTVSIATGRMRSIARAKRRLDAREEALAEHDRGAGDRARQAGRERVDDPHPVPRSPMRVMPPPKAKRAALTAEEIATFRKWIEQGAKYEGHWAFQPLKPALAAGREGWRHGRSNPIDRYILARLDREGIQRTTGGGSGHGSSGACRSTCIGLLPVAGGGSRLRHRPRAGCV